MKTIFSIISASVLLLPIGPAWAETGTEGAIQLAFQNNRELALARVAVARAKSRLKWSGRLRNPELELSQTDDSIGLDDGEGTFEVAFSQAFPLTSRLKDEREVRRSQVLLAEAEIAENRRRLAYEVDEAMTKLLATRQKLALTGELVELNEEIVAFLKAGAEVAEISPLDVTQARLAGQSLLQKVTALENEEERQLLALKKMIGLEPGSERTFGGELPVPVSKPDRRDDLVSIYRRRPDYLLALSKIDVAEAELALANAGKWEDVTVKIFLESEKAVDEPDGLERNTLAGVGVSIPLPIRQKNEGNIEQAEIGIETAEKSVEASEFNIRSEYEAAFQGRLAAFELARTATGEVINLAEKNLADFKLAQENGQASLLQVQRAQEQVLELRTAAIDLLEAYHLAQARLRFVTGNYPEIQPSNSK
ncbi:MAG: TolC family protein [Verrucomicrobiales bacterium]|nr:TolC family protein [Verrucomicrobiales bacterium]